ncbi:dihydroneopterin triphosphate diphosphatase [Chitinimonas arctica]|uniref:Dihydroneopterin triphosphate diphosphatase n=1 Tax=Chitinimonas arctica TaxID=2594795 RepID=A0A516S9R3_9NEIS|nr:dihydroneopterin triphosphate diphosphatase [Chitinimonas arctica]QDQ24892.1 dihydroneopterin triphosphate diphosphatase [Chitinimonas arctica]
MPAPYKRPESVLVVIYTPDLKSLIIERTDFKDAWQSVTGSLEEDETPRATARREVQEEVGIDTDLHELQDWGICNEWEIYEIWRHRYAPGVIQNTEHVFGLLVPELFEPTLSVREHSGWLWRDWNVAAEAVFSPSNADALRLLPEMAEKFGARLIPQGNA